MPKRNQLVIVGTGDETVRIFRPGVGIVATTPIGFDARTVSVLASGKMVIVGRDKAAVLQDNGSLAGQGVIDHTLGWLKGSCPIDSAAVGLFATAQDDHRVDRLEIVGGNLSVVWSAATVGHFPRGVLHVQELGQVWVACKGGNGAPGPTESATVDVLNDQSGAIVQSIPVPWGARGLCRAGSVVYVSCLGRQPEGDGTSVVAINSIGRYVMETHTVPPGPFGLCPDRWGRVWVVSATDRVVSCLGTVWGVNLSGSPLSIAATTGPDRIWVAHKLDGILTEIAIHPTDPPSVIANHVIPNSRPETLGDWFGIWAHGWIDSDGNGQTDRSQWLDGIAPFPT